MIRNCPLERPGVPKYDWVSGLVGSRFAFVTCFGSRMALIGYYKCFAVGSLSVLLMFCIFTLINRLIARNECINAIN